MIKTSPMPNAEPAPDRLRLAKATQHPRFRDALIGYALILPAMLLVAGVLIYPTLFNLGVSFQEWSWSTPADAPKPFVGLNNFIQLLNSDRFWNSFRISLTLVVVSVIVQYLLGLGLALLLNKQFRGQRLFRAIFILPMILAPIVIGIQWRYLLSGNFGIINYALTELGITAPRWLSDPKLGGFVLVMVDTWTWVPFVTLILLAAMQQIPQEVLEAAEVDGATWWARVYHIVLPLLRPATIMVLLLRSTEVFRAFDVPYVLTGGGPGRTTEVLGMLLYRTAFSEGNLGVASALSILIGVIGMVIGTVVIRFIRTDTRMF
ncbi:MAG: sugar ABC transporter permease [Anaerolineae bacterium]|nr:sugar ABC transporter permease [Anaerolineae bacterium]